MLRPALVLATLLVTGCGKPAVDRAAQERVAPVNAAVPASLAKQLVFEQRKIADGPYRYLVPAPRGWKQMLTTLGPDDASQTSMFVVYKCASEPCRPADWNADIDKVYTEAPLARDKVARDDKTDHGRTIVAELDGQKVVLVATWVAGADHYLWCEAHLDPPWSDALAAFEAACHHITVTDSGNFTLQ